MRGLRAGMIAAGLLAASLASAQPPVPNRGIWTCSVDNIAASLTKCAPTPAAPAGIRTFIATITAQSTTGTAGQFLLRTGSGTNCATSTVSLYPAGATVVRYAAPANTVAPFFVNFSTPLIVDAGLDICVLGVATNTVTATLTGYYNP